MCALREKLMESGRCTGKCDHHKKKNTVDIVQGVVGAMQGYCDNKKNCTIACPEFGSTRCRLKFDA